MSKIALASVASNLKFSLMNARIIYALGAFLLSTGFFLHGQYTVPTSGSNSHIICSGVLQDHNGSSNYANNCNGYSVINPSIAGNVIQISGTINTESSWDYVYIYDGVGTGGSLLYQGSGSATLATYTSSSGPLTVKFTSDNSTSRPGFDLNIACVVPSCHTSGITADGINVNIVMTDSYGDGWNGASLDVCQNGTTTNHTFTTGYTQQVDLTLASDENYSISFNSGSYDYEASYIVSVDGVQVYSSGTSPTTGDILHGSYVGVTCNVPSGLSSSILSTSSASISWSAPTPAPDLGYEIYYSTSATAPTSGTSPSTTVAAGVLSKTLTGLSMGTPYYYWVRSNCNGVDVSNWAGGSSFTILEGQDCDFVQDLAGLTSPYNGTTVGYANSFSTSVNAGLTGTAGDRIFKLDVPTGYNLFIGQSTNGYDSKHRFAVGGACPGTTEINTGYVANLPTQTTTGTFSGYLDDNDLTHYYYQNTTGSTQTVYWLQDCYSSGSGTFTLEWLLVEIPPSVTASVGSLSNFLACAATASSEQSFMVSGEFLDGNLVVSPPAGFEISLTSGAGFSSSNIVLTPSGGTVSSTTIYARMASQGTAPASSNITCVSTTASQNVSVTGSVNTNPTPSASASAASFCSGGTVDLTSTSSTSIVYSLTTSGGSYTSEKWVNITTGVNGTGTVAWAQGNGTIGNASGLLTDESIDLTAFAGQTLYLNAYDKYSDSWDGSIYTLSLNGVTVINNGGVSPSDPNTIDASSGWDETADEIEASESFTVSAGSSFAWTSDVGAFTSSDQNPTGASPSETTTYTVTETDANGCTGTATAAVDVAQPNTTTINADVTSNDSYVWSGSTSSTWGTASNWYKFDGTNWVVPASAPGASDKVFVLDDASQACISANDLSAEGTITDLHVKSGATVTLSGALTVNDFNNEGTVSLSTNTLNLKGDYNDQGTFNYDTGKLAVNGAAPQTLTGTNMYFYDLEINNSTGVTLAGPVKVDRGLTLTNGHLILNDNDVTIRNGATINGTPSSSKMIVAAGSGTLKKEFNAASSFTFPVGTTAGGNEYTPVTLTFNAGTFSAGANVAVKLSDVKNSQMNSNVDTYINRTWSVEPTNISGYDYDIELSYVDNDVVQGTYTEGDMAPVKFSGGEWYQADGVSSVFTNAINQGVGFINAFSNVLQWGGLSTFSEFGGAGGSNQPLPVELTSFNGACDNGVISLAWETASENNSSHFDVEKSRDGENWTVLSTIAAAGTSNEIISYQAVDHSATDGNNYFRLRQVDIDGTEKLYDPINVSCEAISVGYFSSYPNPSGNAFQVIVNNEDLVGECVLNMVDAQGKVIERRAIEVKPGINMFVMNQSLKPGMYFLNVSNGSNSTPVIRHSIK